MDLVMLTTRVGAISPAKFIELLALCLIPVRADGCALAVGTANHGHQLRDLFALIGLAAAGDGVFDAMRDVVPQHFFLDAAQRRPHCGDLRDDIDAVAVFIDHFGEPANLALDPAETFLTGHLDVFSHAAYIPP